MLVVGDSLSAEYGIARGKGWVALLEQRIQAEKIPARVVNASISGDTTAGGRSRLGALLDMKTSSLEKVIYFQDYVVLDPKDTPLKRQHLLTEEEYRKAREDYGDTGFEAEMGAEAIRKLGVDPEKRYGLCV